MKGIRKISDLAKFFESHLLQNDENVTFKTLLNYESNVDGCPSFSIRDQILTIQINQFVSATV